MRSRRIKIRVVEDVKHLSPELDVEMFGDNGVLDNRDVAAHQPGSNEGIPGFVTKASGGGEHKCTRIDPLLRIARNDAPDTPSWSDVWSLNVVRRSQPGSVDTYENGEGMTALGSQNTAHFPASDKLVSAKR